MKFENLRRVILSGPALLVVAFGGTIVGASACTTDGRNVEASAQVDRDVVDSDTTTADFPANPDGVGVDDTVTTADTTETTTAANTNVRKREGYKVDNSGINERDAAPSELTAADQGTSEKDVETTRAIRRAITESSTLSTYAQNIKIITINGGVTLKGPVKSQAEKNAVLKIAKNVVGTTGKIHNEIEIAK